MTALVELHLHLEGAAPPAFIRGLAAEKHFDLSGAFREEGSYAFDGFARFLKVYEAVSSVIVTPSDHARLTRAVLEECAAHGAIYVEVFMAPSLAAGNDLAAWREQVAAVEEAAASVPEVILRAIPSCIRHQGPDAARAAARCAAETAGGFVTGWGMGGDERVGKPSDFAWAFDCAREAGLGITCHAGEFDGPSGIRNTLDALRPSRIGHGVRAIEDFALVDQLAEDGIVLELCPRSNVALGLYPSIARHPIERLRERGVAVTVSTDDPPFFGTDLTREYEALGDAFGWDDEVVREVNRTAARAAYCDETTRAALLKRID
jgi:adenosine deaminase